MQVSCAGIPSELGLITSGNILKTHTDGSLRIRMKPKQIFAKVVLAKRIICFPAIEQSFFSPSLQVIWHKVRKVFSVGDQKRFRDEGEESNLSYRLFSLHRLQ